MCTKRGGLTREQKISTRWGPELGRTLLCHQLPAHSSVFWFFVCLVNSKGKGRFSKNLFSVLIQFKFNKIRVNSPVVKSKLSKGDKDRTLFSMYFPITRQSLVHGRLLVHLSYTGFPFKRKPSHIILWTRILWQVSSTQVIQQNMPSHSTAPS